MMMKTLNTIKMKIMVRAFRIRNGEDLDAIRDALNAA